MMDYHVRRLLRKVDFSDLIRKIYRAVEAKVIDGIYTAGLEKHLLKGKSLYYWNYMRSQRGLQGDNSAGKRNRKRRLKH